MKKRIYFSGECGPCGGGNDARNEFIKKIQSTTPGPAGQGLPGSPGKDNIVQGSQINLSGVDVDGNDDALGGGTIATLTADGFNLNAKETIKATLDTSDIANTKWFVRFSNALLNYLATFPARLFKAGGTAGQIPIKINSTDFNWAWVSPEDVIGNPYKTTSATNTVPIAMGTVTLVVGAGLQYTKYCPVAAVDAADSTKYILGYVESYNITTGALIIDSKVAVGTSTPANWIVNVGHTPFLPDMTGKSAYVLSNDGVNPFWSQAATIPTGSVIDYYGTVAPNGWAFADNSTVVYDPALPKSASNPYKDLAITMGANSNTSPFYVSSTSFKLPNRKRRVGVGFDATGTGVYDEVGLTGGVESANITLNEMPPHTHDPSIGGGNGFFTNRAAGNSPISTGGALEWAVEGATGGPTGQGAQTALSHMQPYEVCNVIVKL